MSDARLAIAVAACGAGAAIGGLLLVRRSLLAMTVRGHSMMPTYRDGERLLIMRRRSYGAGDVIMFRAPGHLCLDVEWLVKRAVAVAGDPVPADLADQVGAAVVPAGQLLVRSDAAEGLDSRQLGLINASDVAGVVRARWNARSDATAIGPPLS